MSYEYEVGDKVEIINYRYLAEGTTGFVLGKHLYPTAITDLAGSKTNIEYLVTYIIDISDVYYEDKFNQKALVLSSDYLKPMRH